MVTVSSRARIFAGVALLVLAVVVGALLLFDSDPDVAEVDIRADAARPQTADGPAPLDDPAAGQAVMRIDPDADRPPNANETLVEGQIARVSGVVRALASGAPIAGAHVVARLNDGASTRTDARGEYRIDLVFRLGLLEAFAPGYLPEVWRYPPGPTRARLNELDPLPPRHDFSLVRSPLGTDLTVICKRPDGSTAGGSPVAVRLRLAALADANLAISAPEQIEFATSATRLMEHGAAVSRVDDARSTRLDVEGTARYLLSIPGRYDVVVRDSGLVASERISVEGGARTVELRLAPGVAIPVKVIRDGAPVRAAVVELWRANDDVPETAITGDDGVATFGGLAPGTPIVLHCGALNTGAERGLEVPDATPEHPIDLELPPAAGIAFDFIVVAAESGQPLSGARLRLPGGSIDGSSRGEIRAKVPLRPTDVVSVEAPGRRPRTLTAAALVAAGSTISLSALGAAGARLRLRVVDAAGVPVAGRGVDATAVMRAGDDFATAEVSLDGTALSDVEGFSREIRIDLQSGESVDVFARCGDRDGSGSGVLAPATFARLLPGQDVVVPLTCASATVRGQVTIAGLAPRGPGVRLFAAPARVAGTTARIVDADEKMGVCEADGSFAFQLAAGPVTLTARSGCYAASVTIDVRPHDEIPVKIDLAPARAVRVVCIDSVTRAPIPRPTFGGAPDVDALGAVYLVPRGGAIDCRVRARGYAPAELHLVDSERPSEVRLEMRRLP